MMGRVTRFDAENTGWAVTCWLDPGGTSGWSVMCVEPDALSDPDVSVLKSISHKAQGQVTGDEDVQAKTLLELFALWPDAACGCEDFIVRKYLQGREALSPVRITSKIEMGMRWGMFDVHANRRLWKQQPSLAMNTATDARLKDWGLYIAEGGEEHARDASRHSITFLRRASERPALRHAAWPHLYDEQGELL